MNNRNDEILSKIRKKRENRQDPIQDTLLNIEPKSADPYSEHSPLDIHKKILTEAEVLAALFMGGKNESM